MLLINSNKNVRSSVVRKQTLSFSDIIPFFFPKHATLLLGYPWKPCWPKGLTQSVNDAPPLCLSPRSEEHKCVTFHWRYRPNHSAHDTNQL
uniref:Ovule protein n=1 Tax=Panagrellus redivivus TaxID=6233 RepID=A0A7E4V1Z0_PANRE